MFEIDHCTPLKCGGLSKCIDCVHIQAEDISSVSMNWERDREMFYLTTHSTHFIYGYMASDIWLRTILIVRKETRCRHIGYSYRLTARVLLFAPSHRQDTTYHGICYTSRGALVGTRNSLSMNGSNECDLCGHGTRHFHPSYTACKRSANLPGSV